MARNVNQKTSADPQDWHCAAGRAGAYGRAAWLNQVVRLHARTLTQESAGQPPSDATTVVTGVSL